ncbi:MAG: PilN domain-containing protein [Pyrinomonadaceae bacterium]
MIKVNLLDSVTERASSAAVVEEKVANPAARFWMLGAAVCGVLGLAMVFDFFSASASQAKAKAELEKQQQVAAQMAEVNKEQADLEKKLKDIQSRIDVIKTLRTAQQGPVSLLSDINARIPSDPNFRLDTIEQKGGELTIEGQSPNEFAVTQFGRSLEFSDGLFLNVSLEAERKPVDIVAADYNPADGPVDLSVKPEVFKFKIKCKYGPNAAPPAQSDQKSGGRASKK